MFRQQRSFWAPPGPQPLKEEPEKGQPAWEEAVPKPHADPSGPSRHNDLPWQLLNKFNNQLQDPRANLTSLNGTHTNIPKLKAGFVGAQVGSGSEPTRTRSPPAPPLAPVTRGGVPPWALAGAPIATQAVGRASGALGEPQACMPEQGQGLVSDRSASSPSPPWPPVLVCVHALRHPEQGFRETDAGAD